MSVSSDANSALIFFFAVCLGIEQVSAATEVVVTSFSDGLSVPIVIHKREKSETYFEKHSYSLEKGPHLPHSNGQVLPWALEILNDDVWIYGEFSNTLHVLPKTGQAYPNDYPALSTAHSAPLNITAPVSDNAPFEDIFNTGEQSDISSIGEGLVRDDEGRVWFTQGAGGWSPISSTSYSRVVSYHPASDEFCVYNIPDDNAGVIGIAWDADRDMIWFAQGSIYGGIGAIVSFKPTELPACGLGNSYLWAIVNGVAVNPFPYDYCTSPTQKNCFRKYDLPADFYVPFADNAPVLKLPNMDTTGAASHLAVAQSPHPDAGAVWFTLAFGDAIGRLDPDSPVSSQLTHFPIGDDPYASEFVSTNNIGPWDIDIHPTMNDILITGYGGRLLGRFDIEKYTSPTYAGECEQTPADGTINPCVQLVRVPRMGNVLTTHQIDVDQFGNTWFTVNADSCAFFTDLLPHEPPSIGFLPPDWSEIILFDFLDFSTPHDDSIEANRIDSSGRLLCSGTRDKGQNHWSLTAIKTQVDGSTLNIWFTESNFDQIRRLKYKFPANENIYCKIRTCN